MERCSVNGIPEEALTAIEERFGSRFEWEAFGEESLGSVFPESAEEVEFLTKLAARHSIPLVARGAGTALYPGKPPRSLAVRFDAMPGYGCRSQERTGWRSSRVLRGGLLRSDCARGVWGRGSTLRAPPGPPLAAGWPRTVLGSALTSTVGYSRMSSGWR